MKKNPTIIEKIIISIANRVLWRFRYNARIKLHAAQTEGYEAFESQIKECYARAVYWHGTGRYHYYHPGNSKYDGTKSLIYDVLNSIIEKGGLQPHYDPWVKTEGEHTKAISLTKYRMYARMYAGFHQDEKENFQYEYGSPSFWFYYLVSLILVEGNIFKTVFGGLYILYAKLNVESLSRIWMSSVRKDLDVKPISPFRFFVLRSDIPANYGILIGIKYGVIEAQNHPLVERMETRTRHPVTVNNFTHIEVPLRHVRETEEFIKKKGLVLPVIPLEYGEIYCTNFSLTDLSF